MHNREAKIEAPSVGRSKKAETRYPKLRTLLAAIEAANAPAETEQQEQAEGPSAPEAEPDDSSTLF